MDPSALVIIGFSGDLSKRKLLPSLYNLELSGDLHDDMRIIGVSRKPYSKDELFSQLHAYVESTHSKCDDSVLRKLCDRIDSVQVDVSQQSGTDELRKQLDNLLDKACRVKLFYFAVPPSVLQTIIDNLVGSKVHQCGGGISSRLLIEKPFGHDLQSAIELSDNITKHFGDDSIYLIDHYLAKETVQNVLYFRFHNPLLKSTWSNQNIKNIQINALELLDIQGRGEFYEQTGALRDMLQSHLTQLLALVTMDEPSVLEPEETRKNRLSALKSISLADEDLSKTGVRAQYEGYRKEVGNPESSVETFAAVKLKVNSDRWRGVPIYLRAGKAMENKVTEINVVFENPEDPGKENILTFRIQPHEGIAISMVIKKPGLGNQTKTITLDYCYEDSAEDALSDGYDRILHDAIVGDQTLFPSIAGIKSNWALFQPLLDLWQGSSKGLTTYKKGTSTVAVADNLLKQDKVVWIKNQAWVCKPRNLL